MKTMMAVLPKMRLITKSKMMPRVTYLRTMRIVTMMLRMLKTSELPQCHATKLII